LPVLKDKIRVLDPGIGLDTMSLPQVLKLGHVKQCGLGWALGVNTEDNASGLLILFYYQC